MVFNPPSLTFSLCVCVCPQKLDDTNPAVREAGMECLGTLMRVVGDRPLNSYMESIDKSKMAKVRILLVDRTDISGIRVAREVEESM